MKATYSERQRQSKVGRPHTHTHAHSCQIGRIETKTTIKYFEKLWQILTNRIKQNSPRTPPSAKISHSQRVVCARQRQKAPLNSLSWRSKIMTSAINADALATNHPKRFETIHTHTHHMINKSFFSVWPVHVALPSSVDIVVSLDTLQSSCSYFVERCCCCSCCSVCRLCCAHCRCGL